MCVTGTSLLLEHSVQGIVHQKIMLGARFTRVCLILFAVIKCHNHVYFLLCQTDCQTGRYVRLSTHDDISDLLSEAIHLSHIGLCMVVQKHPCATRFRPYCSGL